MAGFFSNLLDKITGIFKSKDLDSNITEFQNRIDSIINDLITPYAQPTKLAPEDRFRDLITLLDPKKCNKIAITLSNNLDKNYTKLQLEQFASEVLVGRNQAECNDESCSSNATKNINNRKDKVSKKSICNSIAVHYVKMLNLIAAILTAVNPSDNICLNRLRNLLNTINDDEQTGVSSICDPSANAIKDSIMHEPGFKELLMLYYYHLMQDTETEEEKNNVRNQYQNLVKTFSNLVMFVDPSLKNHNNNISNQNMNERNKLINTASSSRANQNTNRNLNGNLNGNNKNNTSLLEETLKNIDDENKSVLEEPISQVSQANLNTVKNEISSKISNMKAEEQQQINSIVQKLENLNRNIANIKEQSKQSQSSAPISAPESIPESIPEPAMNQNAVEPVANQPAINQDTAAPSEEELTDDEIDSLLSELSQPEQESLQKSSGNLESTPAESSNISSNTTMTNQPTSGNTTMTNQPTSGNTTTSGNGTANTTEEINNILESYERSSKRSGNTTTRTNTGSGNTTTRTNTGSGNTTRNNSNNLNSNNNNSNNNSNNSINNNTTTNTTPTPAAAPAQLGGADSNNNNKNNNNKNNNNKKNNKKNNNNNESLVGNTNNNVGNIVNSDIKNSTKENIRLKEFKDFVAYYVKMNVIDENVIDMVNTAFKQSGNFARDSPNEGSMYIADKDFEDFCVANINNNALIPLKISDSNLGDFIKIYKDMKESYLDNCNYLLSLLEKQIL
jgi:hypothetical protein